MFNKKEKDIKKEYYEIIRKYEFLFQTEENENLSKYFLGCLDGLKLVEKFIIK